MLGDNVGIGVWKIGAKIQNNKQPGSLGFFLIGLDFSKFLSCELLKYFAKLPKEKKNDIKNSVSNEHVCQETAM